MENGPMFRIVQKDTIEVDRLVLEYLPYKEAIELCSRYNRLQAMEGDTYIWYVIELMEEHV